jgi:hypothetical protein
MKKVAYLVVFMTSVMSCRKPYNPPAVANPPAYIVVAGVINPGADSTTLQLSRTVNISSNVTTNPVAGAIVSVESDQNVVFPLTEAGNGNYVSPGLNLNVTRQYRLSIKTSNNEQYYSDFVPVTITPPIDSIGFDILNGPLTGIQIYLNTHDPANNTHYYRWDYAENWQFSAKYASGYIADASGAVTPRLPSENISLCYASDMSSDIVLASSAKLQQDVIYQTPIVFIPSTSERLEDEYTIFIRQYALTADAYTFWTNLKKNTEQLGSIFDAQPSQINGNIHCITNPLEPVIGYVSVSTVPSKRVFIYNYNLPAWVATYPYECTEDTVPYLGLVPTTMRGTQVAPKGYYWTSVDCADCTIRGTVTPPPYWR